MRRIYEFMLPGVLILAAASGVRLFANNVSTDPGNGTQAIHIREVTPYEAKAGDILCAYGENLNAGRVHELYLNDGKTDFKVEILEQTNTMIRFRLPSWLPAGKLRVAVLNEEGMMLDQPAFVKILVFPGLPTG